MQDKTLLITDEDAMRELGKTLISDCQQGMVITLKGNLGTGKTTLVRGALQAMGVVSGVRSPTYTLVEFYQFDHIAIAHFDLYRLGDAEELEYLGYRDYLNPQTLCLIEWPERAQGYLNDVDLAINIQYHEKGRKIQFCAGSEIGSQLVAKIQR